MQKALNLFDRETRRRYVLCHLPGNEVVWVERAVQREPKCLDSKLIFTLYLGKIMNKIAYAF